MTRATVQSSKARPRKPVFAMTDKRRRSASVLWWGLPIVLVGGIIFPPLGFILLSCLIVSPLLAAVKGRHWCGWMCPRGAFFDYVMPRWSRNVSMPSWMSSTAFRYGLMAVLMSFVGVRMVLAWPNPWAMGGVLMTMLIVTTIAGVGLALVFKPRTWCRLCPVGTLSSLLAKGKRPLHVASTCKDCSVCGKACPMDLTPQKVDASHADCLKCDVCIERCPPKALSFDPPSAAAGERVSSS